MVVQPVQTIKIFFCYAHEDDDLRKQLAAHLSGLRRLRYITGWFDRDIQAGTDWEHEIETRLDAASIILLLISADFIASDYCYTVEMQRALEKQKAGTAHVIPIILRPAMWEAPPLSDLQALPTDKKPITQWANQDEAWLNVAQGIRELVKILLSRQRLSPPETMILNPDVLDQLGQPPVVTPPLTHSPRETRVLPPDLLNYPRQSPTAPPAPIPSQSPLSPTTQQDKQPLMPSTMDKPTLPNQSQRSTRVPIPWLWLRVAAIGIMIFVLIVVSARTIFYSSIGQTPTSTPSPTASTSPSSSAQTFQENIAMTCNSNCSANITVVLNSIVSGEPSQNLTLNFTIMNKGTKSYQMDLYPLFLQDKTTDHSYGPRPGPGTTLGYLINLPPGDPIQINPHFPDAPLTGIFILSLDLSIEPPPTGSNSTDVGYQEVTVTI